MCGNFYIYIYIYIYTHTHTHTHTHPVSFITVLQITRIMLISKHCFFSEGDARQIWLKGKSFSDRRDKPGNRNLYVGPVTI